MEIRYFTHTPEIQYIQLSLRLSKIKKKNWNSINLSVMYNAHTPVKSYVLVFLAVLFDWVLLHIHLWMRFIWNIFFLLFKLFPKDKILIMNEKENTRHQYFKRNIILLNVGFQNRSSLFSWCIDQFIKGLLFYFGCRKKLIWDINN